MNHGRSQSQDRKFLLGLVCLLAIGSAWCAPTRTKTASSGSSGGDTGSGGISGDGGTGSGGDTVVSSGGDSGGNGGGIGGEGGALGGTSGSGGTFPTDVPCKADTECVSIGGVCETFSKLCVRCNKSADCPTGGHCLGNRCETFTPCASKSECQGGLVCDTTRGVCAQCVTDTDCGTGKACNNHSCVDVLTCKDNGDCPTKICDTANNVCLDCLVDSHCGTGKKCVRNVCRSTCATSVDCAPMGMVCDTSNTACVQCLTSKDCPASDYCLMGSCVADVCDSTMSSCSGTSVAGCNTDGDGFDNYTTCAATKPCTARGAVATCAGTVTRDGGVSDAPVSLGDAGSGSCGGGTTADPCKSGIPKLTGAQTLDGKGTEMCSLPYFVFNAQNAAKVIGSGGQPETVIARVAWSEAGFHAFIEVQDTSVQTVNMSDASQATNKAYLGDSVELYFSSNNNLTGLTSKDSNALHLIIPANGPAVSVKDTGSSGTPSALPSSQYVQAATSTGYAIEAVIPWPGTAPTSGTAIRFDLALNSADKNFSGVDNMRDAQYIYYVGQPSGSSTCQTSDGTVPWCDDRVWCQATVQ